MVASLVPISTGNPMSFTQSEATAAQRTWPFYLSLTADGAPATGLTIAGADFKISKAGGAFGNAAGVVTEMSLGWYAMAFAAADLDTLGALACELAVEAGVDPLRVTHQVIALDLNVATVNPGANGITAATIADGAIDLATIAADARLMLMRLKRTETAAAGGASTITLDAAASGADDHYNGDLVHIVSGTGAGQTNRVRDYVGSTQVATVAKPWLTAPDNTSVFALYGDSQFAEDGSIAALTFAAGAIDAAAIAPDALGSSELAAAAASEIRTGLATSAEVAAIALATRTVNKSLGTISVDGSTSTVGTGAVYMAVSVLDALDFVISASGTWNGATLTAQVCEDPTAAVPVWTDSGTPLTADGTIAIDGPHNAVRVVLSDDGASTAVAVSVAIRKPAGT